MAKKVPIPLRLLAFSSVALFVGLSFTPRQVEACVSPSSVSGAWAPATGTSLCGGTYNVQSFLIASGAIVYTYPGQTVTINATNWIEIAGTFTADGYGGAGGVACGGAGTGTGGAPSGSFVETGGDGGGGGGYGCATGTTCGGYGGYGDGIFSTGGGRSGGGGYDSNSNTTTLYLGSGGAGGDCGYSEATGTQFQYGGSGGAGGGAIALIAPQIQLDSTAHVSANGISGNGSSNGGGGAGGGSGGDIEIEASELLTWTSGAVVQAVGGSGGNGSYGVYTYNGETIDLVGGGGGGGSGGRIKVVSPTSISVAASVAGGSAGAGLSDQEGSQSQNGANGATGTVTDVALSALTVSASASPTALAPGAPATISASANNPNGLFLAYEYDCTGTGSSYSSPGGASATCSWSTVGTHTILVKVLGYNSVTFISGAAPGGQLLSSSTATTSVNVGNAPAITLTIPSTSTIGTSIAMQGVVTDGNGASSYTYAWSFGDGGTSTTTTSSTTNALSHTYELPGTYTVSLTVTDSLRFSGSSSTTIAIAEVDPTVTIGTLPSPIHASTASTFSASASSPSTAATTAGFTYVFSWGDGSTTTVSPSANNTTVSSTHDYATPGTYMLTVSATDEFGGSNSQTDMVTVLDPYPAVSLNASTYSIALDSLLQVTGAASSTYAPAESAGFTFAFAWGDGATTTLGLTSPEIASHSYDAPGNYTLKLTVTDTNGVTNSASATVTVTEVLPTVTIGSIPVPIYSATSTSFSASATSVSTSATSAGFTYVFGWGDGTASTTVTATAGNGSGVSTSHTYATAGTYTLTVTATDKFNGSSSKTATVTVYNKAPATTIGLSPSPAAIEATITATVTATASYSPDGTGGYTFVVNWGDGTSMTTVAGSSPQFPTHVYDSAGTFSVSVSATDSTGVAGNATTSITITDIAPTVTIGPLTVPTYFGVSASYAASATSPSTAATTAGFTYVFAWGDGTASTTVSATSGNGSGVSTTHTYAAAGTFTLTVTATDKFNVAGTKSTSVTIYSKAPAVGLSLSGTTAPVGSAVTATATVSASYPPDGASGYSFTFNWGDGTPTTALSGTSPQAPTHVYDVPGAYTVTLSVLDTTGVAGTTTRSITITDVAPTVKIGTLPSPTYAGSSATYSASVTSPSNAATAAGFGYVFAWGDGTTSTTIVATAGNGSGVSTPHTYTTAGTYTLTVTATDEYSTSGSSSVAVMIDSQVPAVTLTLSPTVTSIESLVTATATAIASNPADGSGGFTFVFNWGDGTPAVTLMGASPQAPTHAYDVPGAYTVSVSATDSTNMAGIATKSITITDVAPTVTIGALPAPVYPGSSVTFSASATSPSTAGTAAGFTYVFTWGDGTANTTITAAAGNGTGVSTTHSYASTGSYSLTVNATDTYGGTGTKTVSVPVVSKTPIVGLVLSAPSIGVETALTATATATAPYAPDGSSGFTFVFNWGDGSTNTAVTGASPQAPTHAYDVPGTYTISVSATDSTAVAGTASTMVTVTDIAPTVTIGALPVPAYAGVSATYSASTTSPSNAANAAGFTYLFAWGDGTASTTVAVSAGNGSGVTAPHTYATAGSYTLTVSATDKYNDTGSKTATVTIYSKVPVISLGLNTTSAPIATAVQATGTATAPYAPDGSSGFSFVFTWGDGQTSTVTGASPEVASHSYDVPGAYTVQLTVTDATGVASSTTKSLTITDTAPTLTIGTIPEPVHTTISSTFTAAATSPSNTATLTGFTYVFAWGDGTSSTTIAPSASNGMVSTGHTYAAAGTFTLTVMVTDKYNGSTSRTASVVVYSPQPSISLQESATSIPVGATETATIIASSPYAGDSAAGFTATIMWGDGHSSIVSSGSPLTATHVYDAPGTETLQVSVTDSTGVAATASGTVTVTETVPTVSLGAIPSPIYAATTTATISASASSPSVSATQAGFTYVFSWGDGTANTTIQPSASNGTVFTPHVFPNPGSYSISVTATDKFGGSGTSRATATVLDPAPTVTFSASAYNGSAGSPVQVTTTATSPVASENTGLFTWSFAWGDGQTTSLSNTSPLMPSHTYDVGGPYTVRVTVTDKSGTVSPSATATVTVSNVAPEIVRFLHPNGLFGSPINFSVVVTDASMADTAAGFEITWNFGDGTPTQTGMNLDAVSHTYAVPGTYTVTVTATDENNLQTTETASVVAADTVPVVTLGGSQTVPHNTPITLTPTITPDDPAWRYTYAWNLGDGTTATSPTVTHSYSSFGMYTVSLTVTDPYGTAGTGTIVLTVVDTPPVASNVSISPMNPSPQQALTLTYAYFDADGDLESGTTIVWYLNGQPVPADNNLASIPATSVQRNQKWYAVVTPKDGYLFGTAVQSNTVLIGDPPPQALGVTLSPALPVHADTLQGTYTYSDAFGYPESGTTISWTRNGVAQANFANQTRVPPPLTKGDVWQVTVTPSDGYSTGSGVSSAAVTVQDTAPVLNALPNVAEPAQSLTTSVSWMVAGSDADGDSLTFDCAIGATDLGAGPTYTAIFPIGTTTVACSVSDGTLTTTGTFTVAIGDVPPVVAVTASQTVNPGTVTLAANGMDPLGRPLTYAWSVLSGPSTVQLTDASTSSVSFTALTAGPYVVQCTVSNGTKQASAQTTVTVLQLAPLVNLGPSPRTMVAGETITLDGSHSVDPNGGALTYQWAVTSGEVQLSSSSTPTVTVTSNVGGRATISLTVSDGAQSASGSLAINLWNSASNPSSAPYALVGAPQMVLAGTQVTLDGSSTFDPNAHPLTYGWAQMSGPTVTLTQAATAQPQFLAQSAGTYVFELTVSDATFTSVATTMVTVLPTMGDSLPIASIRPLDTTVQIGSPTTLDGTGSTAAQGGNLTWQWTRVSGPYVVLSGATSSLCSITPFDAGEVVVQLVVSDGTFSSAPVLATIHSTEGTQTAPTAVAQGPVAESFVGVLADLDGSGSSDPNGLPLLYQWAQLSGGPAAIHGSETAHASFTPSTAGASSFQLTVYDWIFSTSTQAIVTVQTDNVPIAIANGPASGYVGDRLALDGTQSHDPAGAPLTFTWTQMGGPTVTLENASSASPSFSPKANGAYVFQLRVSNGQFTSPPVTVTVQIQNFPTLRGGCTSQPGASWLAVIGLLIVLQLRRRAARS